MPNKQAILILFISATAMIISLKTVEATEATAAQDLGGANKIEYKSEELRDPFEEEKMEIKEQPRVQTEALPTLQVQGIVWGGNFPQAIVNNKVVRIGDTIDGARIANITKDGVIIFFENRQYNLSTSSPISSQGFKKNL